jgi:hypothetical protein
MVREFTRSSGNSGQAGVLEVTLAVVSVFVGLIGLALAVDLDVVRALTCLPAFSAYGCLP